MQPRGTTIRVASNRDVGHTFHDHLTPSLSSRCKKASISDLLFAVL
jgi:hypothetical protein